jgi:hypothetical protein
MGLTHYPLRLDQETGRAGYGAGGEPDIVTGSGRACRAREDRPVPEGPPGAGRTARCGKGAW